MKINKNKFQVNLEDGQEGEKQLAEILLKQGAIIQPLYQYEPTKTPYLFFDDNFTPLVAPDILVIRGGVVTFAECKRKHGWTKNWMYDGRLETGLDNRLFLQYVRLYELSKIPIEIYFIHEDEEPVGIYRITINEQNYHELLSGRQELRRIDKIPKNNNEHTCMTFFDIEDLEKIMD